MKVKSLSIQRHCSYSTITINMSTLTWQNVNIYSYSRVVAHKTYHHVKMIQMPFKESRYLQIYKYVSKKIYRSERESISFFLKMLDIVEMKSHRGNIAGRTAGGTRR